MPKREVGCSGKQLPVGMLLVGTAVMLLPAPPSQTMPVLSVRRETFGSQTDAA